MRNYITIFKNLTPEKKRTFFLIMFVILSIISFLLLEKETFNGGTLSSFIRLLSTFSLIYGTLYVKKVSEPKIHSWIRSKAKQSSKEVFLVLALVFTLISVSLAYSYYATQAQQKYLTPEIFILSFIAVSVLAFTFSLWERWSLLRKEASPSKI